MDCGNVKIEKAPASRTNKRNKKPLGHCGHYATGSLNKDKTLLAKQTCALKKPQESLKGQQKVRDWWATSFPHFQNIKISSNHTKYLKDKVFVLQANELH